LNEMLKAASRSLSSGGRLRGIMVVSEVALAVVLLIGAGLLIRSFLRLESVDPGFRPQKLLTMKIGLAPAHYSKPVRRLAFYDRFLERAESTAGVQDVSLTNALPLANPGIGFFFNIEGRPQTDAGQGSDCLPARDQSGLFEDHGHSVPSREAFRRLRYRGHSAGGDY